jgi:hypothetical protein
MVIQNAETNRYVREYREGTMSREEASRRTRDIYRGGGGSSRAQVQAAEAAGRAAREAQEKAAIEKARIEAEQLAQIEAQKQAEAEKRRIEQLAVEIRKATAQKAQILKEELTRRAQNLKNLAVSGFDIISGGSVTDRRILRQQEDLNKQIENFNKQYSGDLDETAYQKAIQIEKELSDKQNKINQAFDTLATSKRSKVYGFFNPLEKRLTLAESKKLQDKLVSDTEKEIIRLKNELTTTTSRWKKFNIPISIKAYERELERYRAGGRPIVLTGDLPIIPFKTIPKGITSVRFTGTQKRLQDGRTVVNIAYKTSAGRTGKVQGFVKAVSRDKSIGVTAGRSGVKFFRSPTKFRVKDVQSFIGVEKAISKPAIMKLVKQIKTKPSIIKRIFPSKNKIFYHGTKADKVASILNKGLKPGNIRGGLSSSGEVFLTSNLKLAQKYTGGTGKIIQVRLTPQQYKTATKYGYRPLLGIKSEIIGIGRTIPNQNLRLMRDIRDVGNLRNLRRISDTGIITTTRKAKVINQLSAGRVATTKGTRAVKFGSKKIDYQDFIALSKVLSKRDLSFITGRAITGQGAKSKFIGMIKDLDKIGTSAVKFSPREARLVQRGVTKLVNTMVGSIGAAEKVARVVPKINKLAVASQGLKIITTNPKIFTPQILNSPSLIEQTLLKSSSPLLKLKQIPQLRFFPKISVATKVKTKVRLAQLEMRAKLATKLKIKTLNARLRMKQRARLATKLKTKMRSPRLKQLPKLELRQKTLLRRGTLTRPESIKMGGKKIVFPFFRLTPGFRPQQLSRPIQTFYVVEKIRGKFRKLYPKPLVLKDARDYAVYSIDNNLSRTAFFVPLGRAKRVVRPPRQIQNYASRNSFKVRPYRIRFGKRRQLVNGYIEKRRFFQDTSGERNALRVTRKISPQRRRQLIRQLQKARMRRFGNRSPQRNPMRRQVGVRPKRKMSLAQRNVLIARLKRARAVRMRMLRRRR